MPNPYPSRDGTFPPMESTLNIREILSRRDQIRTELTTILDAAPDGDLPAEARARFDSLEAEAGRLNDAERRQALVDDLARRAAGTPLTGGGGGDPRYDTLTSQVSVTDVLRAQLGATDAAAGRAREASAEMARRSGRPPEGLYFDMRATRSAIEKRVFSTTTPGGGPGSNLIATDVANTVIDRLRERSVVRKMGATVLGGLTGNVSLPRLKASATAFWVAENQALTVSDPQTDAVTMSPKHCGGLVEISRQMLLQTSPDVTVMIENDLAQLLSTALDQVALVGGGTNQPSGILASGSGVTIVAGGTNGAALSWPNIVALIASVDQSNALTGSLGFVTNAKAVKSMMQVTRTTTDTASNFLVSDPATLASYPMMSTQNIPATGTKGSGSNLSAIIFGDWSQLLIGFWSELDLLLNPYDSIAYPKGNVLVRAMMTCDVAIKHPLAFAAITDVVAP